MKIKLHNREKGDIAELISEKKLTSLDDFLDLIGNVSYQGVDKIIIRKINLTEEFFDLKTKIAGNILQKFSTYSLKLAIVGDFSEVRSNSLRDFIRESNRIGRILFVESLPEAVNKFESTI